MEETVRRLFVRHILGLPSPNLKNSKALRYIFVDLERNGSKNCPVSAGIVDYYRVGEAFFHGICNVKNGGKLHDAKSSCSVNALQLLTELTSVKE